MYRNTYVVYFWRLIVACTLLTRTVLGKDFDARFAASKSIQRSSPVEGGMTSSIETTTEDIGLENIEVPRNDPLQAVVEEEDIYASYYDMDGEQEAEYDAAVSVSATPSPSGGGANKNSKAQCASGYDLLWFDDFVSSKSIKENWNYVVGNGTEYGLGNGWGNGELQTYTNSSKNVRVSKGNLQIIGRKDSKYGFTSGKVRTYGKFSVAPSGKQKIRIDIQVRLPRGTGLWPSLTLLPEDSPEYCLGCGSYGEWAQSGAVTLAQRLNKDRNFSGGILYGGPPPQVAASTFEKTMNDPTGVHRYTLEWETTRMKWMLDGKTVYSAQSGNGDPSKGWYSLDESNTSKHAPFNKPFYILVGMALGGDQTKATPAQLSKTLKSPQSMYVDYIRVCEK